MQMGDENSQAYASGAVKSGGALDFIHNPSLNKNTGFTMKERDALKLRGLFPPVVESMSLQVERVMTQIREEQGPKLDKYSILQQLSTTNERLYYKVLEENIVELLPIVYTPTVGDACMKFDRIYRAPVGMYFSTQQDKGYFRDMLDNWPHPEVDIIVVTDGGRILGLGDLGTNGMGISIGKISLYVAGGGFHPNRSMPVCLDVGTDRLELVQDKYYLGSKSPRLTGDEHMEVVKEFCFAVRDKWPHCLIQFEDFKTDRAFAILRELREECLCFNDDIQGTGAVVLSGFINGMKAQGTDVKDARVVFFGAGSSACGVAAMIMSLLTSMGASEEEARNAIYLVDTKGLITTTRGDTLARHKQPFARRDGAPEIKSLEEIVAFVKPHALFGLSGGGPAFDERVVKELCKHQVRPLIFPLSNPSSKAEITAKDAYTFSEGKCLFAAGSPFDPVEYNGQTFYPGQGNNVFIFPGVGLGAVAVKAKSIPDDFLIESAKALAEFVNPEEISKGKLYPDLKDLRKISLTIATRVANMAFKMGLAQISKPADLKGFIQQRMYSASYNA